MELTPKLEKNGRAFFHPTSIKIDPKGLSMQGLTKWEFPHPTLSGGDNGKAYVVGKEGAWLSFTGFKLTGQAYLSDQNKFDLLEPMGYQMILNEGSEEEMSGFFIKDNEYTLLVNGKIKPPSTIKALSGNPDFTIPFFRVRQLFYFTWEPEYEYTEDALLLVDNLKLNAIPNGTIFDFSEDESPELKSADKNWKGIYFPAFTLRFPKEIDGNNNLEIADKFEVLVKTTETDLIWLDDTGLTSTLDIVMPAPSVTFNQFQGNLHEIRLKLADNTVSDSYIKGAIFLEALASFVKYKAPLTISGLEDGLIDENLAGKKMIFNEGSTTKEAFITVKQAVFFNNDRLKMTVDYDYPSMGISVTNLQDFQVWGDGNDVGFGEKDAVIPINQRAEGKLGETYSITITHIAVARIGGYYVAAGGAEVVTTEDVVGPNGPPVIEFASTVDMVDKYGTDIQTADIFGPGFPSRKPSITTAYFPNNRQETTNVDGTTTSSTNKKELLKNYTTRPISQLASLAPGSSQWRRQREQGYQNIKNRAFTPMREGANNT